MSQLRGALCIIILQNEGTSINCVMKFNLLIYGYEDFTSGSIIRKRYMRAVFYLYDTGFGVWRYLLLIVGW